METKLLSKSNLVTELQEFFSKLESAGVVFVSVEAAFGQRDYIISVNPVKLAQYAIANGGAILVKYATAGSILLRIEYCGTDYLTNRAMN